MSKQRPFSRAETVQFCRTLSLHLHAGITAAESLFLQAETDIGHPQLQKMAQQLEAGQPLHLVLAESGAFAADICGLVQVGERSGQLEEALSALAEHHQLQDELKMQLKQSLVYPILLLLLTAAVLGILLTQVLPVFAAVYATLGSYPEGIFALLLRLGALLRRGALPLLALAAAVILLLPQLLRRIHRTDRGFCRKYHNANFVHALYLGLHSGMLPEEAAALAVSLLQDSPAAARRGQCCTKLLQNGTSIGEALQQTQFISAADAALLSIALRSGQSEKMLQDLTDRMTAAAHTALLQLLAKIEPTIVLSAALLVGSVLLAVMLPLLNIMNTIG